MVSKHEPGQRRLLGPDRLDCHQTDLQIVSHYCEPDFRADSSVRLGYDFSLMIRQPVVPSTSGRIVSTAAQITQRLMVARQAFGALGKLGEPSLLRRRGCHAALAMTEWVRVSNPVWVT